MPRAALGPRGTNNLQVALLIININTNLALSG